MIAKMPTDAYWSDVWISSHSTPFSRDRLWKETGKKYVNVTNAETYLLMDRLCGLVVRVPGYGYGGPGFDSRRYQMFWEAVGLERGPLSLVRITEELLE
jgi:hypothetical protein